MTINPKTLPDKNYGDMTLEELVFIYDAVMFCQYSEMITPLTARTQVLALRSEFTRRGYLIPNQVEENV